MARFERDEIEARRLPTSLGTATEDLRSTIESEVTKIVERAEARAAEIETQALEKASRIEQSSEARAQEVFRDSRERLTQMLAEIDAIERAVGEAVRSLRTEAERLSSEIESAKESPVDIPEPPPAPVQEPPTEGYAEMAPDEPIATEAPLPQPESEPESEPPPPEAQDPAVREMIRQQLLSLAESGRTRPDAERMLLRFRQGEQYHDLLDEIYPEQPAGRRGLLRRRKS